MNKEIQSYINTLLDSVIDIKKRIEKIEEDATTRDGVVSEQIEGMYDHIDNLEYSLNDMSSDIESPVDEYDDHKELYDTIMDKKDTPKEDCTPIEEASPEYNFFDKLRKAGAKTTKELIDEDDFSHLVDHEGVDGDKITMTVDQLKETLQKSFDRGREYEDIDIDINNLYEDDDTLITKSDAMGSTTFAITTSN